METVNLYLTEYLQHQHRNLLHPIFLFASSIQLCIYVPAFLTYIFSHSKLILYFTFLTQRHILNYLSISLPTAIYPSLLCTVHSDQQGDASTGLALLCHTNRRLCCVLHLGVICHVRCRIPVPNSGSLGIDSGPLDRLPCQNISVISPESFKSMAQWNARRQRN
jgi:hypothetical protein